MEAAAPVAPVIAEPVSVAEISTDGGTDVAAEGPSAESVVVETAAETAPELNYGVRDGARDGVREPLPIAVSGELKIMPPATGLPVAQGSGASGGEARNSALKGLLDAIPAAIPAAAEAAPAEETTAHGN
jgi:hypothetical protein